MLAPHVEILSSPEGAVRRVRFQSRLALVLGALGGLWLPVVAAAQLKGGDNGAETIPTLGGVGIGALAGVLAIAGAWALSRNRNKE